MALYRPGAWVINQTEERYMKKLWNKIFVELAKSKMNGILYQ